MDVAWKYLSLAKLCVTVSHNNHLEKAESTQTIQIVESMCVLLNGNLNSNLNLVFFITV